MREGCDRRSSLGARREVEIGGIGEAEVEDCNGVRRQHVFYRASLSER